MAKENPLYGQMIAEIKQMEWAYKPVDIEEHKGRMDYLLRVLRAEVGIESEYELDWDESCGQYPNEKIVVHGVYQQYDDGGTFVRNLAFDVKVFPSLMDEIVVALVLPEITVPYEWFYKNIQDELRDAFTKALLVCPIVSYV